MKPSYEIIRLVANVAKTAAEKAASEHCPPDHVRPTAHLALAMSAVESAATVMSLGEFQAFIAEIWNSPTHKPG